VAHQPSDFDIRTEAEFQALFDRLLPLEPLADEAMARILSRVSRESGALRANPGLLLSQATNGAAHGTTLLPTADGAPTILPLATRPLASPAPAPARPPSRQPAAKPARPAPQRGVFAQWWANLLAPKRLMAAGALAAVLLLAFLSVRFLLTPSAALSIADGSVTVLRGNTGLFQTYTAPANARVRQGDQILTNTGTAALELFPGQVASLNPGSILRIDELSDEDGATRVALDVAIGLSLHDIDAKLGPGELYRVTTPSLTASVVGTEFALNVSATGETQLATIEGTVQTTVTTESGDLSQPVDAGEKLTADEDKPPVIVPFEGTPNLGGDRLFLFAAVAGQPVMVYSGPDGLNPIGELEFGKTYTVISGEPGGWYNLCCFDGQAAWVPSDPSLVPTPPTPEGLDESGARDPASTSGRNATAGEIARAGANAGGAATGPSGSVDTVVPARNPISLGAPPGLPPVTPTATGLLTPPPTPEASPTSARGNPPPLVIPPPRLPVGEETG
ncbi:MAG: hypothetical protein ACRC1H_16470, partial [Caldilineaceae bacterium]